MIRGKASPVSETLLRRRTFLSMAMMLSSGAWAAPFRDPLDSPSPSTKLLDRTPLAAVSLAGSRVVAVGLRGLIIVSDDGGQHWRQAKVPVSTELVGLRFIDARKGWAVGHGGVVLRTLDGGLNWERQFDGRQAAALQRQYFKPKADAGDETATRILNDVELNYADGPEQAILDVWFDDELHGFACGSFGTLFATADGGRSWTPWADRVDATEPVHLNAIYGAGGNVYIASERGMTFRLDRGTQRFVARPTGYRGSFFGVLANPSTVVAFGLRGTAYRSTDAGDTWTQEPTGVQAAINGGTVLADGRFLLVTQDGQVLLGEADGTRFKSLPLKQRGLFQAVVQTKETSVVLVGLNGPQVVQLN